MDEFRVECLSEWMYYLVSIHKTMNKNGIVNDTGSSGVINQHEHELLELINMVLVSTLRNRDKVGVTFNFRLLPSLIRNDGPL